MKQDIKSLNELKDVLFWVLSTSNPTKDKEIRYKTRSLLNRIKEDKLWIMKME